MNPLKDAFEKAGYDSANSAVMRFAAVQWSLAEQALAKAKNNPARAVDAFIGLMDADSFRDGPLLYYLKAVAEALHRNPGAGANVCVPQGQCRTVPAPGSVQSNAADDGGARATMPQGKGMSASPSAVPPSASDKAISPSPQGQATGATSEADHNTVPEKANETVPQGQRELADAGAVPQTIAEAKESLPQGQRAGADAIVPHAAAGAKIIVPQGQDRAASAAARTIDEDLQVRRNTGDGRFVRRPKAVVAQKPSRKNYGSFENTMRSIYDRELGMGGLVVGVATRTDFVNLRKKGLLVTATADRFLTDISWPDDDTPLIRCSTAEQVKAIFDAGYRSLDTLGVTNVAG